MDGKIFCPLGGGDSGLGRPQRQSGLTEQCEGLKGGEVCQTRGLIAVTPPVHKARWVLVPVLGRQPGRELEGCPVSAQRSKDGHHPVGRERRSWPKREVRILTARVVCLGHRSWLPS